MGAQPESNFSKHNLEIQGRKYLYTEKQPLVLNVFI